MVFKFKELMVHLTPAAKRPPGTSDAMGGCCAADTKPPSVGRQCPAESHSLQQLQANLRQAFAEADPRQAPASS